MTKLPVDVMAIIIEMKNANNCCIESSESVGTINLSSRRWSYFLPNSSSCVLKCKDCPHWYGGEDYGYGSCRFKLKRKDEKYLTFGQMDCDEGVEVD